MINEKNCSKRMYTKVRRIIDNMLYLSQKKNNDLRVKHYACAVTNGNIISPIMINHSRFKTHGKITGTSHAELGVVRYLCNVSSIKQRILRDCRSEEKN